MTKYSIKIFFYLRVLLGIGILLFFFAYLTVEALAAANPQISLMPASGPKGTIFFYVGTGFTSNGGITEVVFKPDGTNYPPNHYRADNNGYFAKSYDSTTASMFGTYKITWFDDYTQLMSNQVSLTITTPTPTPPGAFTLTAQSPVCDSTPAVRINWTVSNGETSYAVYRNGSLYVNVLPTDQTFYNSANVIAGQSYSYYVRATNAAGSTNSNTVTVTIPANICTTSLPNAPSNILATALSSSRIALAFQDNANNESGFKIERKASGGIFSQINTTGTISGSGSNGYYEDTGLLGSANYCYRARAYNSVGDSAYSNETCATTQAAPSIQPTVNTGFATNITVNSATLNNTVNPNGTATGAFFQWGNTYTFGNITP